MDDYMKNMEQMNILLRDLETGPMCGYCRMENRVHGQFCPMKHIFSFIHNLKKDRLSMKDCLDKLSRLGNGPNIGNSEGNQIAKKCLDLLLYK